VLWFRLSGRACSQIVFAPVCRLGQERQLQTLVLGFGRAFSLLGRSDLKRLAISSRRSRTLFSASLWD